MLILSYNVFDMNIEVLKLALSMTHGESMENYLVSFSGFLDNGVVWLLGFFNAYE